MRAYLYCQVDTNETLSRRFNNLHDTIRQLHDRLVKQGGLAAGSFDVVWLQGVDNSAPQPPPSDMPYLQFLCVSQPPCVQLLAPLPLRG